jgi:hypothetical protein
MIEINGASLAPGTPFGGMKQSGNGREGGKYGIEDFLEAKAIAGWPWGSHWSSNLVFAKTLALIGVGPLHFFTLGWPRWSGLEKKLTVTTM